TVRDPHMVEGLTRRIATLALDRRAGVALSPEIESAACGLLRGLLILLDHDTPPEMSARGKDIQAGWRRLTAHIQEHLHAIGGVRDLVKLSGFTRSHFARAFRLQMGISPREYLIHARIALAKELLRESALSVTEVAQRTGYSEIFRFSRQFKQRTGLTPSDYRTRQSAG
ncbi:MAG: helix-turn-helix transcriptional regulator, partial [Lentisphaerae bacterium]|nr:helix-turn-helix transcriptional regulator [Lentisphaerota bacterium]